MLAPLEVVLQTGLLQDCLISLGKPLHFLADVMGIAKSKNTGMFL